MIMTSIAAAITHHELVVFFETSRDITLEIPHFFLFDISAKADLTAAPIRGTAACFACEHEEVVFYWVVLAGSRKGLLGLKERDVGQWRSVVVQMS